jgi:FAD/FMN-containing dehydrogenase
VPPAPELDALQGAIAGDVVLPGSSAYDAVGRPQIARFRDVRPQAVVLCATATDVAETIALARRCALPIAMRSGGHCFAGRSSTSGIVVDVTPMNAVSVADGVATVGAGARLGDIYDALDERGLTIAGGCGPTVGIAGLTLGGGLGIMGRKHGLTCDQLLGAQLVLADGRTVECDEHRADDLFWALRGAGAGNFGVVTTLVFRTLPAPPATRFHLLWPHARAPSLIEAWQAWAPAAPDELAASLLVTAGGDADPEPVVHLFGAMLGTEDETTAVLDEAVVAAGADPASASLEHRPYREIKRHLAEHGPGEPSEHGHAFSRSEFFGRPLPSEAIAALVESFAKGRPAGQARELDFTPWGGAYNRVRADATAFVHRDERFLLKQTVVVEPDAARADAQAGRDWLARSWEIVHPWGSGRVYPNFPDPDLEDWADAYYGPNCDRLLAVKAKYDPDGVFSSPESLSPSARRARSRR